MLITLLLKNTDEKLWNRNTSKYLIISYTVREANFEQEGNFVSSKKVLFISLSQRINFVGV